MTTWRTLVKRALAVPWRLAAPLRRTPTRWVVTFHEVGDHPWATSPARFREHVEALRASAAVVPLTDLLAARDEPETLRVALTFDDGYAGVVRHAVPALDAAGLPASVFLPTDLLADSAAPAPRGRGLYEGASLLGWDDVRRLAAGSPLAFESHGAAHVALTALSAEERLADLRRSRARLEAETGRAPRHLAYPFGAADAAAARAAREAGFAAALTTRHGGLRAGGDAFLLPRVDVRADYAPSDLLAILDGAWDFLRPVQALRRARA